MWVLFALLDLFVLFLGLVVLALSRGGRASLLNNLSKTFLGLFRLSELPPLPFVDVRVWGLLLLLLWLSLLVSADTTLSFAVLRVWWNDVFLFIWDFVRNTLNVLVFILDLFIPLYNWVVTLYYQFWDGTAIVLVKCQVSAVGQGAVLLGETMVEVGAALTEFVKDARGPFNAYNATLRLRDVVLSQESALECACDGLSPVFGVLFDALRSNYLGNFTNESVNVFVGFFQTLVLSVPPYSEVVDFARVFGPLKRALIAAGLFLDEGVYLVLQRTYGGLAFLLEGALEAALSEMNKDLQFSSDAHVDLHIASYDLPKLPVFSALAHFAEGVVGLLDLVVHMISHAAYEIEFTYRPVDVHHSFMLSIDCVERAVFMPSKMLEDLTGLDTSPVSLSVAYFLRGVVGVPMAIIDWIFFLLRGEALEMPFFKALQRMDGRFGECSDYVSLQCDVFQHFDRSTYEAERWSLRYRWIPIYWRIVSRTVNVFVRLIFSIQDMVEDEFFHVPVNCGYAREEDCTRECQFYYHAENAYVPFGRNPDVTPRAEDANGVVPCNSQVLEWIFYEVEGFAEMLSGWFSLFRAMFDMDDEPSMNKWCTSFTYPSSSARCARSNRDWICATRASLREAIDVPLNLLRHVFQALFVIWAEDGDVFQMLVDDRLCDASTLLYALSGNAVSFMPTAWVGEHFEEDLTNLVHSLLVGLVDVVRVQVLFVRYVVGLIVGAIEGAEDLAIDWSAIQSVVDDQLINEKYRRVVPAEEEIGGSVDMVESTAQFVVTVVMILLNYMINVMDSLGSLLQYVPLSLPSVEELAPLRTAGLESDLSKTGKSNFFNAIADILGVLKNGLSRSMLQIVTLHFKVLIGIVEMFSGSGTLAEVLEDFVMLVMKWLGVLARIASSIIAGVLRMLGPVGEFIIMLWKGICAAGDAIEFITGADFGSVCDAVDEVRRRLSEDGVVDMPNWDDGDSECALLAHHYHGRPYSELVYLERVRVVHCKEMRAYALRLSEMLGVRLPEDMFYDWKRKWSMLYEVGMGFMLYVQHPSDRMMREWDRLGLPHYWLHLWGRVRFELPWLSLLDDAMKRAIEPVPELVHLYGAAKDTFVEMHAVWTSERHDFRMLRRAREYGAERVERFRKRTAGVWSQKSRAWGLKTSIDTVGPLQCVVADNFWEAMVAASERVVAYYSGPFVLVAQRTFLAYILEEYLELPKPRNVFPELSLPSTDAIKDALLFNFELCEDYQVTCAESDRADRLDRITESLWFMLFALVLCLGINLLGVSLFALYPGLVLIPFAHVWNYRWTCLPNIPECLLDDILMWLGVFHPLTWEEYFPLLSSNASNVTIVSNLTGTGLANLTVEFNATALDTLCPVEHPLWSSAYLLSKTWLVYPLEFAVYGTSYVDVFNDWITPSARKDECLVLLGLDLVYIPIVLYGVFSCWSVIRWALRQLLNGAFVVTDALVASRGMEE
tara:strand:- start:990 stop:5357 length:4368 start_codon:yes stop_codon:yes gene_type:complete